MKNVLSDFIKYNDQIYDYKLENYSFQENVTIHSYKLYSQKWPINDHQDMPASVWVHNLIIFIPKILKHHLALLYVNGGINLDTEGNETILNPKEYLDYARIATKNMAPVINLENVPNQFIMINGKPKKEDQILAYSYKLFMQDPVNNVYLLGHLPMAKAIVKAMDAAQQIVKQQHEVTIDQFILSGLSKRGWATWLAAIEDDRVSAIIPVVIDILNVQKSISHICSVYEDGCPYALRDYKEEGITNVINSEAFATLMAIEDPFSYLQEGYDNKYRAQFSKLAKYIINSSGDDFFVPDCSKYYFKELPGENNYIRYLPNSMHYLKGNFISDATDNMQKVEDAISDFFYFIINDVSLPKINYSLSSDNIVVNSSKTPTAAILWSYNNEQERDFRFLSSYSSWNFIKKKIASFFGMDLCDRCYDKQSVEFEHQQSPEISIMVKLPPFAKGWQASFLELHYDINNHDFIITTEVNIVGKNNDLVLNDEL